MIRRTTRRWTGRSGGAVPLSPVGAPDDLPLDPDLENDQDDAKPAEERASHPRLSHLMLVVLGGTFGTGLREAITLVTPTWQGVPVVTMAINIVGAFVLGALLEGLVRRGEDRGARRAVRLAIGTGVLGGFTTYSALATDTVVLLHAPGLAIAYALGTVLLGAAATALGIAASARFFRGATS